MNEIVLPEKNAFNALRLICCLIIIVGHCLDLSGLSKTISFRPIFDMHVCVCVFFILSGFFVTRSYLQKKQNGENVLRFYKRRASRILPSYYIVVLLCAVGFYFLSGLSAGDYFSSSGFWKYIFWNVLLLNFVCPSPLPNITSIVGGGKCIVLMRSTVLFGR